MAILFSEQNWTKPMLNVSTIGTAITAGGRVHKFSHITAFAHAANCCKLLTGRVDPVATINWKLYALCASGCPAISLREIRKLCAIWAAVRLLFVCWLRLLLGLCKYFRNKPFVRCGGHCWIHVSQSMVRHSWLLFIVGHKKNSRQQTKLKETQKESRTKC